MSSLNSPLLRSNEHPFHRRSLSLRRRSLRQAVRVLQRASSHSGLMMRQPSDQINDNDNDNDQRESSNNWAYSKPVVILDLVWNFLYLTVAVLVLFLSREENPEAPLRVWVVGYCLLCVLHVVCLLVEYRRRGYRQSPFPEETFGGDGSSSGSGSSSGYVTLAELTPERTSNAARYMDYANTTLSIFWWTVGFYWVCTGGPRMVQESPKLYWLCIVFLAFDVLFVAFCIVVACVIGLGVCCCLPCVIAVAYSLAEQKGANKEDIEQLPKYIFRCNGENENENSIGEIRGTFGGFMSRCGTATPAEHSLPIDAADCSICLSTYNDGDELRELPCGHHFHYTCIDKWLYMCATCPLCKRSIRSSASSGEV